jgi:hypothetical protein
MERYTTAFKNGEILYILSQGVYKKADDNLCQTADLSMLRKDQDRPDENDEVYSYPCRLIKGWNYFGMESISCIAQ